jgi:hypothetical protein
MVPSLSLLLKEDPDGIYFQEEDYSIHSEEVFCTLSAVYNVKSKKPAVIVSMKGNSPIGSSWIHKSNDKEIADILNKYFWESLPWHSDIMETLAKNGFVDGKNNSRYGMLVAGRCWEVNTGPREFKVITSFWQGHNKVKSQLDLVKMMFQLMNKDITKSLFEFPNKEDVFLTYNEAFASLTPVGGIDKKTEKILQQIQHISPEAKKSLLKMPTNKLQRAADKLGISAIELRQALGMDVAETQDIDRNVKPERSYHLHNFNLDTKPPGSQLTAMWINEDPDSIYTKDEDNLGWGDRSVVCVFSIFKSEKTNQKSYVAWGKYYSGNEYHVAAYPSLMEKEILTLINQYANNQDQTQQWKNKSVGKLVKGESIQHLTLLAYVAYTGHTDVSHRYEPSLEEGVKGIHGRVWLYDGILYASFWNKQSEVRESYRYVKDLFKRCKLDMDECMYEFIDHRGWMDNNEAFLTATTKEKRGEELVKKLMAKQHTDPNVKRVLAQMQGLPVNKLTRAADKLGLPPIKLYQMIHTGD